MSEVAIIMCTEEVANKWIDEQVSLGCDRRCYSYHDDTLWKSDEIPEEKESSWDDLSLF